MSPRARRPSWTTVPESVEPGLRLAQWLPRRFPDVAADTWADRLRRGLVVDAEGQPLSGEEACEPRLRVGYYRETADEPAGPEVEILEIDEHLIVVDKPHFLPVTPSGPFIERCVLHQVERQLGLSELAAVHRLDRHTAGLVLLARVPAERGLYCGLFARRKIERCYEAAAWVDRELETDRWLVRSRIEPGEPFFRMRSVATGAPNAETEVELLADHRTPGETVGLGSFHLRPRSGKKHQIRLHMCAIGCPIAGDRLYPNLQPERPDPEVSPLALVATELRFEDPVTGEERRLSSRRKPSLPATPHSSTRSCERAVL